MSDISSGALNTLSIASPTRDAPIAPAASGMEPAQRESTEPALRARAEQAAIKFEGLFISQMLKQMRKSAHEIAGDDGLFKSQADNGLLELADTMVADSMAGQRAFGIADAILHQLLPPAQPAGPVAVPVAAQTSGSERFNFSLRNVALEHKSP